MSKIKIEMHYRPFSNRPGALWWVPGTTTSARIYPTRIELENEVIDLPGPVTDFRVFADLDRGSLELNVLKDKKRERLFIEGREGAIRVAGKVLPTEVFEIPKTKLSLGKSCKLDCARMHDLKERLPLILRLGSGLPKGEGGEGGPFAILEEIGSFVQKRAHDKIASLLTHLINVYFSEELYPHVEDFRYFGYPPATKGEPLDLLYELTRLCEAFFFEDRGREIALLATLLPQFSSGRFIGEEIAMRWTKKQLFSLELRPKKGREVALSCPHATTARLKIGMDRRGRRIRLNEERMWEEGHIYTLDQFEK